MSAAQAAEVFSSLRSANVRCWVMGGWGVDALLGRVTREHHDLDLIVHVADLPTMHLWLRGRGFQRKYDWEETRSVRLLDEIWSTAFVEGHPDGREVDVHCIDISPDGRPELATADPWTLPDDTLTGEGVIDGATVNCVSKRAQLAMHVGYDLPPRHEQDLKALGD